LPKDLPLTLYHNGKLLNTSSNCLNENIPTLSHFLVGFPLLGGKDSDDEEEEVYKLERPCAYFQDGNQSPTTWFIVVESSFEARKLRTSRQKFNFILPLIPTGLVSKLTNTIKDIADPLHATPNETLKSALSKELQPEKAVLFNQYFKKQSLRDLLPTQFFEKCIGEFDALQPDLSKDESILRTFFLSSLPSTTQQILTVLPDTKLKDLALAADKMAEINKFAGGQTASAGACSVTPNIQPNSLEATLQETLSCFITTCGRLNDRVMSLETTVQGFCNRGASANSRRSSSKFSFRSPSPRPRKTLCRFHYKYKNAAKFCHLGCQWENRSPECKQLDLCIFHDRFKKDTRKCVEGCVHHPKKTSNAFYLCCADRWRCPIIRPISNYSRSIFRRQLDFQH